MCEMIKCASLFEIVNMCILACEIFAKMPFFGSGPTLSPPNLIIVG